VPDSADRLAVLAALLPWLKGASRARVPDDVAGAAPALPDTGRRLRLLLAVLDARDERDRDELRRQVLDGIADLEDFDAQVSLIAALVPRTPQPERRALIEAVRKEYTQRQFLWPSADVVLARSLADAADTLPRKYRPALINAVHSLDIGRDVLGDTALRRLIPYLSATQRKAALPVALQSWRERAFSPAGEPSALGELAPYLSIAQASGVLQDNLQEAMGHDLLGAELIAALAPRLSADAADAAARFATSMTSKWLAGRALLALQGRIPPRTWKLYRSQAQAVSPDRLRTLMTELTPSERDEILTSFLTRTWEMHAGAAAPPRARRKAPVKKAMPRKAAAKKAAPAKSKPRGRSGASPEVVVERSDYRAPAVKRTRAAPSVRTEPVLMGVTAPRSCLPGQQFNAVLAAYVEAARASAQAKLERLGGAGAVPLMDIPPDRQSGWIVGAPVTVRVTASHADVEPAERTFEWNGRENLAAFTVRVHDNAPGAELDLCFHVALANVPIASIPMPVALGARAANETPRIESIRTARSAFASYSSKDAQTVGYCLSSLTRWSPGLAIFQDCLDLKANESFKPQLANEIKSSDVFMLFWSRNALASPWVRWEYDTARQAKGLAAVIPMPLEDPKIAPPPPEFDDAHMRDRFMVARYALAKIDEVAASGR
jgi:hypothetical protein